MAEQSNSATSVAMVDSNTDSAVSMVMALMSTGMSFGDALQIAQNAVATAYRYRPTTEDPGSPSVTPAEIAEAPLTR